MMYGSLWSISKTTWKISNLDQSDLSFSKWIKVIFSSFSKWIKMNSSMIFRVDQTNFRKKRRILCCHVIIMDHIIRTISYGSYHMHHIIWIISSGPYDIVHIIWTISQGTYHMDNIIWTINGPLIIWIISYGRYDMVHMYINKYLTLTYQKSSYFVEQWRNSDS